MGWQRAVHGKKKREKSERESQVLDAIDCVWNIHAVSKKTGRSPDENHRAESR